MGIWAAYVAYNESIPKAFVSMALLLFFFPFIFFLLYLSSSFFIVLFYSLLHYVVFFDYIVQAGMFTTIKEFDSFTNKIFFGTDKSCLVCCDA